MIWADLDPNAHMRHTAYNDYAAQVRVGLFDELNLPLAKLVASGYGPILFHEDTSFKSEVFMNERITVTCTAQAFRKDLKISLMFIFSAAEHSKTLVLKRKFIT